MIKKVISRSVTVTLLTLIGLAGYAIVTSQTAANAEKPEPRNRYATASLQHFTLGEMVDRAGRIFRGTVISAEPGTVELGGTSLPTVTYEFRVDQAFKGEFDTKDGIAYTVVTMLGSPKATIRNGDLAKLNSIPAPTLLSVGTDQLMILTPTSEAGLTVPVGLGQGRFEIFLIDKTLFAKNEYNNAGLFDGPVEYSTLAAEIRREGGNE